MGRTLRHRGPDDDGTWADEQARIAFAHRRLAILDLTLEGHQPMQSHCGRYMMTYNGEVYNFQELRQSLETAGHRFRGRSDTEVVLTAFTEWGVVDAIPRFNGMFALAVWDTRDRILWLARDRVAEKPLYVGWAGGALVFASQLAAIREHPQFAPTIDRDALVQYLRYGYIPAPRSIYERVQKVPPGTILRIDGTDPTRQESFVYWSATEAMHRAASRPFRGSEADGADELERLLRSAVTMRMISDVPLGAFLSGGLDSSTVVALVQAQSTQPVRTFSIGFHERAYNEADAAKLVAAHLRTSHTELYVTPTEARSIIPRLPSIYDEPFADPAQVPTCLLAALTRKHVTVSLSGDGGDELFAGYARYLWGRKLWRYVGPVPARVRQPMSRALAGALPWLRERIHRPLARRLRLVERAEKASQILALRDEVEMYRRFMSPWLRPETIVRGGTEPPDAFPHPASGLTSSGLVDWMMRADFVNYFQNDILVNVDRATMAVGLEGRIPFTDHRTMEFAWSLAHDWKLRGNVTKWLLRKVLYKYVPAHLVDRPKMGFGVPIGAWMRGPLRDWASELLSPAKLRRQGYFDPEPIVQAWRDQQDEICDRTSALWSVLMFQAWLEESARPPVESSRELVA
jgi:asparagine synthase (glutamine-hydrolysing)